MIEKRLLREAGGAHWRVLLTLAVAFGTLGGFVVIAQAHTLAGLVNGAFLSGKSLLALASLLALFALVVLARAAIAWLSDVTAHLLSHRARGQLRFRLIARLFALGPAYQRGARTGEVVNVLTDGVESLDSYVAGYLPQAALAVTIPLLILAFVFPVDPLSGLVLLLSAPVIPVFMVLIGRLSQYVTQRRWSALNWMSGHFLDVLQGLTTLQLFGRERAQVETVGVMSDRFRVATMRVLRVAFLSALVMELTATLSTAVVAVEIGVRLLSGAVAFEQALFVLMLAPEYYLPLRTLGARHHAAMAAKAASGSIAEILDAAPPAISPATFVAPTASMEPAASAVNAMREAAPPRSGLGLVVATHLPWQSWQALAFEGVSYTYHSQNGDDDSGGSDSSDNAARRERVALAGCTFAVRRGERVGLVGPSGAGKSTIAHLLLRFIEPTSGVITLDGIPLASVSPDAWRTQIAWAPQTPYLFNMSALENIRLARLDASMDDVVAAVEAAHAREFIEALPQGYDTLLGERGARLSGGQAQRIALARAFLRDAPILLLDEATSHLDPISEAAVLTALERLSEGRTVLLITHRPAPLALVDRVLALRQGLVVGIGSPRDIGLASRSAGESGDERGDLP
ncbi:MAG TPA: ABC transporter ATP-binding protein/permease [Ktedonobacterales bacterium]|nr:ABC transporter ATP-binding protein/permease [Ktedonobacterales bacterium]